ncbi:hypothetical protein GYMLUDRAFT_262886 [Collybiopsis luxurians FD-317 M1]|uniref:Squalene monooxygenase n=1 Tax=Collybiopsis luxurians FD-317 M1 TaxID=944289 RepID=A0A0D0C5D6_9AGAR|nr:hypothetical protein GYMLUDRAFT_262886 [Collybiopsis luxurians FD-317 M1]
MSLLQFILIFSVLLYGLMRLVWGIMRWHLLRLHSGLTEMQRVGKVSHSTLEGTAVVCGGSVAGLLTARICHDFFEHVMIVEPEGWLAGEDGRRRFSWEQEHSRTRIMQYQSLHGNQALMYHGLEKLFPDFQDQCTYSGIRIKQSNPNATFAGIPIPGPSKSYGGHLPNTIQCSRAGLETLIRRLVLNRESYPRIEQITGTVLGISPSSDDASRIQKVRIRGVDMKIQEVEAAMVADCTGTTRAGVKWLNQAGYGVAQSYPAGKLSLQDAKITFDQKLHYTSLICTLAPSTWEKLPIPSDQKLEDFAYSFMEDLPERGRRLLILLRNEGNRLVIFTGQCTDETVKYESLDEIRGFLNDLVPYDPKYPVPKWLFRLIDILEETRTSINYSHVRVPGTSYIRYHDTVNLPSNFVALGDSVMSIDPLFGQGCTKAMLGAVALHATLSNSRKDSNSRVLSPGFSKSFFKKHFNKTDGFWQTTRLLDYGVPCTKPLPGENLRSGELLRWYIRRLRLLSTKDEHARRALYDGAQGFASPIDTLHPLLVLKVIWNAFMGVTRRSRQAVNYILTRRVRHTT